MFYNLISLFHFYFESESPYGRGDFYKWVCIQAEVMDLGEISTKVYREAKACIKSTWSIWVVRKGRRKTRRFLCMETEGRDYTRWWQQSIRWDSPTGSRRSGSSSVPWRSVWLGRTVWEGWWERERDCRVKRHEFSVCVCSNKSLLSLGLCSPILTLHFPNWSSSGQLPWHTHLCVFSCMSVYLKVWPRTGCNAPTNQSRTEYAGTVSPGSYTSDRCRLRWNEFIVSQVTMLDYIKTYTL